MNWEAISAIGQLVSAVGVVVSLVYLGMQVSMSNRLAKAEAWRSRFSEISNLNAAFGVNPNFDRAMIKLYEGKLANDMEVDEISLLNSYMVSYLNVYEQLYREVQADVLKEDAFNEFTSSIFKQAYFKEAWSSYLSNIFPPGFVAFMQGQFNLVAQSDSKFAERKIHENEVGP
jgi:hypothetical protein